MDRSKHPRGAPLAVSGAPGPHRLRGPFVGNRTGACGDAAEARLALSVGERGLTINGTMLGWDAHSVVLGRDIRHHQSSLICHSLGQDQHLRLDWLELRLEEHTRVAAVIKASWTRHQQRHPSEVPAALTALLMART